MSKAKPRRIQYTESGGGWGNPLMGRVFDSNVDVPDEERNDLFELLRDCDLSKSGELPGRPPTDSPSFEIQVEEDGKTITVVGDMQRADDKLRALVSFIRRHSRRASLR